MHGDDSTLFRSRDGFCNPSRCDLDRSKASGLESPQGIRREEGAVLPPGSPRAEHAPSTSLRDGPITRTEYRSLKPGDRLIYKRGNLYRVGQVIRCEGQRIRVRGHKHRQSGWLAAEHLISRIQIKEITSRGGRRNPFTELEHLFI